MKKQILVAGALAATLALPLIGCGGQPAGTTEPAGGNTTNEQSGDFDAVEAYWGQWRGSVETTGSTVYGDAAGSEPMLDIDLGQDGSCTVEPLETHADLPSAEGTWEGTETEITLHLSDKDVVLTVAGEAKLEGDAADFGIADFDTINFDFYG